MWDCMMTSRTLGLPLHSFQRIKCLLIRDRPKQQASFYLSIFLSVFQFRSPVFHPPSSLSPPLFLCLSLFPSLCVCVSVCVFVCLSVCLSPSLSLSYFLSLSLCKWLSFSPSLCLSPRSLSLCPSPLSLPVCLCLWLS